MFRATSFVSPYFLTLYFSPLPARGRNNLLVNPILQHLSHLHYLNNLC
uniref:Uncharacterized protein n=1 Tax=Anguilla anguilla TaxID=7936 RepID=A0A0E9QFM1_ANGAN